MLVNALQRHAAVMLQKSTREGFGLTVTEAMWKRGAIIGGIRRQINNGDGLSGRDVEETAERIVWLLNDPDLRKRFGARARESARGNS